VVTLKIKGQVQVLLRCVPPQLVFSRVEPGEQPTASAIVYSQTWDQFDIEQVTGENSQLTYTVEEATQAERQDLDAAAAHRLTVTLSSELPEGYFDIPLQISAVRQEPSATGDEPARLHADCSLSVQGKVLRRLSAYGPQVDARGTILMGRVMQGRSASVKLLLKLRDEEKQLTVRRIETSPDFLQVRLEPHQVEDGKEVGLYQLHVEVPATASTFRLPPDQTGFVRLEFDHPRVPHLQLPVDLVVYPRSEESLGSP
jgi:hypothetical protein